VSSSHRKRVSRGVEVNQGQGQAIEPVSTADLGSDKCPPYRDAQTLEKCPRDTLDAAPREGELIASLPKALAAMARIVPLDAVMKISARYGGTRMYLARDPAPGSEIARLVGQPIARALGAKLGGAEIEIPRARTVLHKIRNPEIRRLRTEGASLNDLALRFGLTTRQLRRICNGNSDSNERAR